jgi:hypothetical protein
LHDNSTAHCRPRLRRGEALNVRPSLPARNTRGGAHRAKVIDSAACMAAPRAETSSGFRVNDSLQSILRPGRHQVATPEYLRKGADALYSWYDVPSTITMPRCATDAARTVCYVALATVVCLVCSSTRDIRITTIASWEMADRQGNVITTLYFQATTRNVC